MGCSCRCKNWGRVALAAAALALSWWAVGWLLDLLCPHAAAGFGRAFLAVVVAGLGLDFWLRYYSPIMPVVETASSAVVVIGADESVGWDQTELLSVKDVRVFATMEDLESVPAQRLRRYPLPDVHVIQMDPRNDQSVATAARRVADALGNRQLKAVIYTASTPALWNHAVNVEDVQRAIEINALAPMRAALVFAPLLRAHGGRFIFVGDIAGRLVLPSLLPYSLSQVTASGIIKGIRSELQKYNVPVTTVEPLLYTVDKFRKNANDYPRIDENGKLTPDFQDLNINQYYFSVQNCITKAFLTRNPMERYFPTLRDYVLDKIISLTPPCFISLMINNCPRFYVDK